MPSRTRFCGEALVTSTPLRMMRPEVGLSMPVNRLINVVLPAPFGPISACRAPASNSIDTSSVAVSPPNRLTRWLV